MSTPPFPFTFTVRNIGGASAIAMAQNLEMIATALRDGSMQHLSGGMMIRREKQDDGSYALQISGDMKVSIQDKH